MKRILFFHQGRMFDINGAVLIFDEIFSTFHEFQAFYDYATAYQRTYTVLAAAGRSEAPYTQVALQME